MADKLDKRVLNNGMVILGEPMEAVESVAFGFILPAGAAMIEDGCCGAANIIEDWIFRGAGEKNTRQLSDALDNLGLQRSSSAGTYHLALGAGLESENLSKALALYGDIIRNPLLGDEQFTLAKQQAINEIQSLDDDPRRKVMLELRRHFYPQPLGRSTLGLPEEIDKLNAEKTRGIVKENFNLSQTIFSVAGKYDFDSVCSQLEELFETNEQVPAKEITLSPVEAKYSHIHNEGAQVHIGLMTKTVLPTDPDFYNARVALSVLSGGMSARLFTEVREKRGLCYAIGARYHSLKQAAGMACYAGTTPEKAQQTLDVIIDEFNRLVEGISEEEIQRAKVGLESSLILSSESSSSRASAIAGDYFTLSRVRSLDEIKKQVDKTSVDSVLTFLKNNPFEDFTVVTIGPEKVSLKK